MPFGPAAQSAAAQAASPALADVRSATMGRPSDRAWAASAVGRLGQTAVAEAW